MGDIVGATAVLDRDLTTETRVIDAALVCIGRFGLTKTTLDDVVRESGISRATIYRAFPGGRDTLFDAVIDVEVERFFDEVVEALAACADLEDVLTAGISTALRFITGNRALRTILELEPGLLLPRFAFHRLDRVFHNVTAAVGPYLEAHVGDRSTIVAEQMVRIVLTYAMTPSPRVDPRDAESVRRLVRLHILPGLTPGSP